MRTGNPDRLPGLLCSLFLLAASIAWQCAAPAQPPNIIVIITDDQGWGDFGVQGNAIVQTPNLDNLARASAALTRFYVSPVCAPTRASLMTGRYNYRTRVIDTYIGRAMMDPTETTIAELFRDSGYSTGIFGKWHLGDNFPMRPQDQGFQEVLVHKGGGIGQPSDARLPHEAAKYTNPTLWRNGVQKTFSGYCTDVYFEHAQQFIARNAAQNQPFFTYIATNAPHGPFHDVPEALYEKYLQMDLLTVSEDKNPKEKDKLARVFAMIENIDDNIGRLDAKLAELGIRDNTIVLFMLDNGPNTRRFVGEMRGRKGEVLEGGIRSPLWMRWPAKLKAGTISDGIAAHIDVLPTLLAAAGIDRPAGLELDGRNVLPLLQGESPPGPERVLFIQAHRGNAPVRYHHFAAIAQRYKLVHNSGFAHETLQSEPALQLFDLWEDPGERQDLRASKPDVFSKMQAAYDTWFDEVGNQPLMNFGPPRIIIGAPQANPVTLTRQDWRHFEGKPWAKDSNGFWLVQIAETGRYRLTGSLHRRQQPSRGTLSIGSEKRDLQIAAGADSIGTFDFLLRQGKARVLMQLESGDVDFGPWQLQFDRLDF